MSRWTDLAFTSCGGYGLMAFKRKRGGEASHLAAQPPPGRSCRWGQFHSTRWYVLLNTAGGSRRTHDIGCRQLSRHP